MSAPFLYPSFHSSEKLPGLRDLSHEEREHVCRTLDNLARRFKGGKGQVSSS